MALIIDNGNNKNNFNNLKFKNPRATFYCKSAESEPLVVVLVNIIGEAKLNGRISFAEHKNCRAY